MITTHFWERYGFFALAPTKWYACSRATSCSLSCCIAPDVSWEPVIELLSLKGYILQWTMFCMKHVTCARRFIDEWYKSHLVYIALIYNISEQESHDAHKVGVWRCVAIAFLFVTVCCRMFQQHVIMSHKLLHNMVIIQTPPQMDRLETDSDPQLGLILISITNVIPAPISVTNRIATHNLGSDAHKNRVGIIKRTMWKCKVKWELWRKRCENAKYRVVAVKNVKQLFEIEQHVFVIGTRRHLLVFSLFIWSTLERMCLILVHSMRVRVI